jgi:pimeloyl-ACP methyl ester carboxylesterase
MVKCLLSVQIRSIGNPANGCLQVGIIQLAGLDMPEILSNGQKHYYELSGEGTALVLIHGAFVDARIWEPQWKYFSSKFRVLRYDLRGHGRTGASDLERYTMTMYADDLASLLDALEIDSAVVCGLSMGGGIAQAFAVRYLERLKGLILVGSTVSMSLTLGEQLLRYVLFPRWAMMLMIRRMSVERFVNFSYKLAALTLGKQWLNRDDRTLEYLRQSMLQIKSSEYLKIWDAIYGFDLHPLEKINCPTLVLIGARDSNMIQRHAREILRRVPTADLEILPSAYHAITLEEPAVFNKSVELFLGQFAQ